MSKLEKITFHPDGEAPVEFFVLEQTRIGGYNYILVTDFEEGDGEALILKDLSEDGDQEAIVDFRFGENSQVMCMILKWDSSEIVYGMEFYYRQMSQIKEDGSFAYSGGGDNDGWAKLRWENNDWVKEKVEDSEHKSDVQWYPYPITHN